MNNETAEVPQSSEPQEAALVSPSQEEIRKSIYEKLQKEFEVRFAREIGDFKKELQARNDELIKNEIDSWRKEQEPPSQEDIKKLLSQEYMTFDVVLFIPGEDEKAEQKTFVLWELPQTKEKEFLKKIRDQAIPIARSVGEVDFSRVDDQAESKVLAVIDQIEPLMNLLSDAVVIALNPRGKLSYIDREWVQNNVSTQRQWAITMAQMEIQRLRDFFSQLSRSSMGLGTATRAIIQP